MLLPGSGLRAEGRAAPSMVWKQGEQSYFRHLQACASIRTYCLPTGAKHLPASWKEGKLHAENPEHGDELSPGPSSPILRSALEEDPALGWGGDRLPCVPRQPSRTPSRTPSRWDQLTLQGLALDQVEVVLLGQEAGLAASHQPLQVAMVHI